MKGRSYYCRIVNVVATGTISYIGRVDLPKLVQYYPGIEYRPELFPGAIFRLKRPRSTTLIFSSGKLVNTGTKSEEDSRISIKRVIKELNKFYENRIGEPKINIQNIVARVSFELGIDLEKASYTLSKYYKVLYEPAMFPGEIVRLRDEKKPKKHNVVALLYNSGNCVITGTKSTNELDSMADELYNRLEDEGLFFEKSQVTQ